MTTSTPHPSLLRALVVDLAPVPSIVIVASALVTSIYTGAWHILGGAALFVATISLVASGLTMMGSPPAPALAERSLFWQAVVRFFGALKGGLLTLTSGVVGAAIAIWLASGAQTSSRVDPIVSIFWPTLVVAFLVGAVSFAAALIRGFGGLSRERSAKRLVRGTRRLLRRWKLFPLPRKSLGRSLFALHFSSKWYTVGYPLATLGAVASWFFWASA